MVGDVPGAYREKVLWK